MDNIILNVSSIFRDKSLFPDSTNFEYKLPTKLKNIIYIRLTSVEIPNINYVIKASKNNNSFQKYKTFDYRIYNQLILK